MKTTINECSMKDNEKYTIPTVENIIYKGETYTPKYVRGKGLLVPTLVPTGIDGQIPVIRPVYIAISDEVLRDAIFSIMEVTTVSTIDERKDVEILG